MPEDAVTAAASKPAPIAGTQKQLKAFLERRHPDYAGLIDHWNFLESTYEGGRDWFTAGITEGSATSESDNIFRYVKEGDKEYQDRLKRAYRFNHTKEVTDLVQKYIFKTPVIRNLDDAPEPVKAFWLRATPDNLDINQFMKLASTASSILGRPWIFVDSNVDPDDVVSIADAKKAGAQVYAYIVKPQDVLDIGYSKGGECEWVLLREWVRDDADPVLGSGEIEAQYRLWTEDEWHLFEIECDEATQKVDVVEIDQGFNQIKRVPGFPLPHVLGGGRYSAPGLINDIAYLDRAIANYLSNLDAIIQDQTFSQLAMPAQAVLPGTDAYKQLLEMSTKRVFVYDGEGGSAPAFLSPDPRQAGMIVTVVNKIINEIYHTIGMAGERTKSDNNVGIDNSSGVAKAYDFERMNSLLTSKADSLENAENSLVALVMLFNSQDVPEEELVKYPDTFDVRSLFDEFTLAERLAIVDAPKLIRQEQMGHVIDKLFPRLSAKKREEMDAEIAKWPVDLQAVITAKFGGNTPDVMFPAVGSKTAGGAAAKPGPSTTKPTASKRQGQVTKNTPAK